MRARAWLSWSTGKDSAWALRELRRAADVDVVGLLSVVTADFDRVSMHGVRRSLLERQAAAVGLPLHLVEIPAPCQSAVYEARMGEAVQHGKNQGVTHVAFGDVFLRDVRAYRETMLRGTGIEPLFPLWGRPTASLARSMVREGLQAVLTSLDPHKVTRDLAGRAFDEELLDSLPADVDPCAENGEFHTFVWDAPGFREPISVRVGEVVERDGFVFADVVETD